MGEPTIIIDTIGGWCPVQAEGTINGQPFYFRSRGDAWSLGIGGDPVIEPAWEVSRPYGQWPDAGYMPIEEAEALIRKWAAVYAAGGPGDA